MKKLLCALFPSATAAIRAEGYQGAIDDLTNKLGLKVVTPRKRRPTKPVATPNAAPFVHETEKELAAFEADLRASNVSIETLLKG